jgi:multidrug efflux pump subunit AcrA (membrane-fusion protein)
VIRARLQTVSSAGEVDQQTRLTTFPIVIDVTTDEGAAWINVPAQAEIVLSVKKDVVVLPDHCLRTDPSGRSSVNLQGAETPMTVEVGTVSRERVEIASGLEAGQTVLCRGSAR